MTTITVNATVALSTCPCCGYPATLKARDVVMNNSRFHIVKCSNVTCGLSATGASEERVAERWNRRLREVEIIDGKEVAYLRELVKTQAERIDALLEHGWQAMYHCHCGAQHSIRLGQDGRLKIDTG